MHFPIIALEDVNTPAKDFKTDLGYEDRALNYYTDYYGDIYTAEERKKVINSDWLKAFFKGIATVDTENETITFLDADTIRQTKQEYLIRLTKEMYECAAHECLGFWEYMHSSYEYDKYSVMFYDGYGKTSYMFIADAPWHAGQTMKIGNIFDAKL